MQLGMMWRELARPFQVTVVGGIVAWAFLARYFLPFLMAISEIYPTLQFGATLSGLFVEVLLSVFFVGLATVPLAGAIGLLTVRMNESNRGILALFVTFFSFFPLLFLGFDAFAWVLQNWQLAILVTVWVAILWMMARTSLSGKVWDLR